jgi:hypothetical protein
VKHHIDIELAPLGRHSRVSADGQLLTNVRAIEVRADVDGVTEVTLTLINTSVSVRGQAGRVAVQTQAAVAADQGDIAKGNR